MNTRIDRKLWVLRFCLKVVYPKFNFYTFLVFLTIKYRIWCQKKLELKAMNNYSIKIIPAYIQRLLITDYVTYNLPILLQRCILIPREEFIQLCSENLFYVDNGVLWLALKLTPKFRKKYELKKANSKYYKNCLDFVTSEIHKKLFSDHTHNKLETIRIVPVVGSKYVKENTALTTEQEYSNLVSTFGLGKYDDIQVSFHPVPSFECSPKIAVTAEVCLVTNKYNIGNNFIKEVLSNHFETPILLSENDIFSIELTPNITTTKHYHKYSTLITNLTKLYFKCNKINEGKCEGERNDSVMKPYFIVKGVTQLVLGESLNLIKPKDEYLSFNETYPKNMQLLSMCPTGLKQKFDQIQEIILPFLTGDINELSTFLSSPIIPLMLLTGLNGSGKHTLVKILAKYNGMNYMPVDCISLQSSTAKRTESKINSTIQKSKASAPVIVLLDNFEIFAVDSENNEDCRIVEYFINIITDLYQNYTKHPIFFIALTQKQDLKQNVLRLFLEKIHIPRLNAQQRYEMLQWFTSAMQLSIDEVPYKAQRDEFIDVNADPAAFIPKSCQDVLQRVAAKTETFMYGDIDTLLHFAMRESFLKQQSSYVHLTPNPDLRIVREEDFNSALESIRSLQSQHLDAPKIPKVYWEDIGGLEKLKKELLKTIEFPIKYPHFFKNSSLKRSGILLYGPPGCGKTLVAKAVSTELNVSFMSVKGPELLNMYIGQSEENVRNVFESARASSPCIVFLDELDALAPRRGAAGDSGGASDRVVSQLLAEVDGVACGEDSETSSFVFIMGATNRPDLLEQSLLRPGRLDKLIYVGPYNGLYEKTSVLKALCRKYRLKEDVCLEEIAAALPVRCTGADLLAVVDAARAASVRKIVQDLQNGLVKESEFSPDSVVIGVQELMQGVESFHPSVTDEELAYYESLGTQM